MVLMTFPVVLAQTNREFPVFDPPDLQPEHLKGGHPVLDNHVDAVGNLKLHLLCGLITRIG